MVPGEPASVPPLRPILSVADIRPILSVADIRPILSVADIRGRCACMRVCTHTVGVHTHTCVQSQQQDGTAPNAKVHAHPR